LFLALLPNVQKLSIDAFGNYVVQKLLEHLPGEHKALLGEQLLGHVLALSLHTYGCRVIQRILDTSASSLGYRGPSLLRTIAKELTGSVVKCVEDQNGNHVVQKCVERLPLEDINFIPDEIRGKAERLSLHCYGCRVIQRLLERLPTSSTQSAFLTAELLRAVKTLAQDQYGNYVVQHAIDYGRDTDKEKIMRCIAKRDLVLLSCNKFASNVVEKAVRVQSQHTKILVDALCSLTPEGALEIMRDRYGNYVIRAFLELPHLKFPQLQAIKEIVYDNSAALKKFTYGWHLVEKLHKSKTG
jgi:pumilio RNA-binding family